MDLLISMITWLAIIEGLGFIIYPFILTCIGEPRISYALSKCAGIFTFGYVVWLLGLMQLLSTSLPSLCVILAAFVCIAHWRVRATWGSWEDLPYPSSREIYTVEGLFLGTLAVSLLIVAFHPEIYWGEKPMDFTFLNFFIRNDTLPPQDPWSSGNTMNYYYLGPLLLALLHKLSGLQSNYGYGLSIATIAALIVTTGFAAIFALTRSLRWSSIGAVAVTFIGTLDAVYLFLGRKFPFGFDLYWATSRTLHSPGINEYPLWSILFADLHAHYIALPVTLCMLTALIVLIQRWLDVNSRSLFPLMFLSGFFWGILSIVNSWDYITYGIVAAVFFGLFAFSPYLEASTKKRLGFCGMGILTLCISVLVSLPFHISVSSNARIGYGAVVTEEFNSFFELFRIHGHWLLIIALSPWALRHVIRERSSEWNIAGIVFFLFFGFLPLILGLWHRLYLEIPGAPWGVLLAATVVCITGMLLLRTGRREPLSVLGALLVAAGTLYSVAELYFFMDRMNTTFKVYNALWMLSGISAVALLSSWITYQGQKKTFWQMPEILVSIPILFIAWIGGVICIAAMVTFQRTPGPRPTLDGTAYLAHFNSTEKPAFDWINSHIRGTPVLLEAWGPSYQEYTRFSMHTGLPVVLGWEYHILQRGTAHEDMLERKQDVATIYTTSNPREAVKLLNKYSVDLIVVGQMERKAYGTGGLNKFDAAPNYFIPLFSHQDGDQSVRIYTTAYSSLKP